MRTSSDNYKVRFNYMNPHTHAEIKVDWRPVEAYTPCEAIIRALNAAGVSLGQVLNAEVTRLF